MINQAIALLHDMYYTIKTLNHTPNVDFNLQNLFCMEYFIKHLLNGFNYLYKAIEKEIENY